MSQHSAAPAPGVLRAFSRRAPRETPQVRRAAIVPARMSAATARARRRCTRAGPALAAPAPPPGVPPGRRHVRRGPVVRRQYAEGAPSDPSETTREQPPDARRRLDGQPRPVGLALDDGAEDVGERLALEGRAAGEHLVEHAAERPDVGAAIHRLPARLLRRHVGGGAEDDAGLRHGRRGDGWRRLTASRSVADWRPSPWPARSPAPSPCRPAAP